MIGNPDNPDNPAKTSAVPNRKLYVCGKPFKKVFRFKITLQEVEPVVWRRIEVPDCHTFWDLHVALTDAFGWLDYHLHEFQITCPRKGDQQRLGSPDDEGFAELEDLPKVKPDWKRNLSTLFSATNRTAKHLYDFGDGWEHAVELEEIKPREEGVGYPRCIDGENACPPDDCGGPYGYRELLNTIRNPRHKEHKEMVGWLRAMKGPQFDPASFDPAAVHFDDPAKRWKVAFAGDEMTPDMRCWQFYQDGERGLD